VAALQLERSQRRGPLAAAVGDAGCTQRGVVKGPSRRLSGPASGGIREDLRYAQGRGDP
jgi:hypothetical protein